MSTNPSNNEESEFERRLRESGKKMQKDFNQLGEFIAGGGLDISAIAGEAPQADLGNDELALLCDKLINQYGSPPSDNEIIGTMLMGMGDTLQDGPISVFSDKEERALAGMDNILHELSTSIKSEDDIFCIEIESQLAAPQIYLINKNEKSLVIFTFDDEESGWYGEKFACLDPSVLENDDSFSYSEKLDAFRISFNEKEQEEELITLLKEDRSWQESKIDLEHRFLFAEKDWQEFVERQKQKEKQEQEVTDRPVRDLGKPDSFADILGNMNDYKDDEDPSQLLDALVNSTKEGYILPAMKEETDALFCSSKDKLVILCQKIFKDYHSHPLPRQEIIGGLLEKVAYDDDTNEAVLEEMFDKYIQFIKAEDDRYLYSIGIALDWPALLLYDKQEGTLLEAGYDENGWKVDTKPKALSYKYFEQMQDFLFDTLPSLNWQEGSYEENDFLSPGEAAASSEKPALAPVEEKAEDQEIEKDEKWDFTDKLTGACRYLCTGFKDTNTIEAILDPEDLPIPGLSANFQITISIEFNLDINDFIIKTSVEGNEEKTYHWSGVDWKASFGQKEWREVGEQEKKDLIKILLELDFKAV